MPSRIPATSVSRETISPMASSCGAPGLSRLSFSSWETNGRLPPNGRDFHLSGPQNLTLTMENRALDQDLSPAFAAFLGRGGPSTGGSDLRYSAIALRSSGFNCEVFLITRTIEPPALSPSGISPVSRK